MESYSKTKNFQLTADEIQVLASGVMEVEVLEKKRTVVGDGFNFWIKIKARVSTDKMEEMAKRVKEKSVVEDYKKIQEAYDKSQKEIEELKRQLAGAKNEKEKKQVEAKIADDERLFQAETWFENGYDYYLDNNYDEALSAYNKAISYNPNEAYFLNRGLIYSKKGQGDKSLNDYSMAISLNPNYADAYYIRGRTYYSQGKYNLAITDFNKVILLEPNYHDPMYKEGNNQFNQGDSAVYYWLGMANFNIGNDKKAIDSLNKAIIIGSSDIVLYNTRGMIYESAGKYDRAIEDYSKAIALDQKRDGVYYFNRGNVFVKLGSRDNAMSDFQKACEMGYKIGCENLQKALQNR